MCWKLSSSVHTVKAHFLNTTAKAHKLEISFIENNRIDLPSLHLVLPLYRWQKFRCLCNAHTVWRRAFSYDTVVVQYEFIRQQDGIVSSREVRVGQNLQNAQQKHDLERADNHDLARIHPIGLKIPLTLLSFTEVYQQRLCRVRDSGCYFILQCETTTQRKATK